MTIAERVNPDHLNIHQFQETPEDSRPELPFDVERDLSDDFKTEAMHTLKVTVNESSYMLQVGEMRIVWPGEDLDDKRISNEDAITYTKKILKRQEQGFESSSFVLSYISALVCARPNINLENSIIARVLLLAEAIIVQNRNAKAYLNLLNTASNAKKLDPKREDLTVEETLNIREEININNNEDDIVNRVYLMEKLRYLDSSYHPELSSKEWQELREKLPNNGVGLAASMKILAAHKVEVVAPGVIDIQMYPPRQVDINQSTPSIPEIRKF
jgi:hypothetical protein